MKALIALLLTTTIAHAEPMVIAAGKTGGGYDAAAQRLKMRLEQRSIDAHVNNFNGSDEITLALCSKRADVGFTQVDAIYARAMEGCNLRPLGLYGKEFAYIFFPPDSRIDELDELDETKTVLVDTVGSGSDLFWHTIVGIETDPKHGNNSTWASAASVNEPVDMAPTLAEIGDIHALIMVRKPDSRDISNLLALGWKQGWLYDKDIDDVEFNERSLYESIDGKTYEVRSFVVAGPNFDSNITRQVQQALK